MIRGSRLGSHACIIAELNYLRSHVGERVPRTPCSTSRFSHSKSPRNNMPTADSFKSPRYLLKQTAGRANPPNSVYLDSLTGSGRHLATAEHWFAKVLGHRLLAVGSDFDVSIRLMLFVLMPSVIFTRDVDRLTFPIFLLPAAAALFLKRLVSAGLPDEVLPDEVAARALVSKYAKLLTDSQRTFDANLFVSNPCEAANFLGTICPPMVRGGALDNAPVADFLCLLDSCWAPAEANSPQFTAHCTILVPQGAVVAAAPMLTAMRSISHQALTAPEPPLFRYVPDVQLIFELARRQEPSEEGRFRPLFDLLWATAYTPIAQAFPHTSGAAAARNHLAAFALACKVPYSFSPEGVLAVCSAISPQLQSLELEEPAAKSSDEERFAALVRLHKEQPGGKIAATSNADGSDRQDGENVSQLLSDPSYMALYTAVNAKVAAGANMADVVVVVSSSDHPAGMVLMLTNRKLNQPAWQSVKGFKLATAWRSAFNMLLATDKDGGPKPNWGNMLPMVGDECKVAGILLRHAFTSITDWHALCVPWIVKAEGTHVLSDPRYSLGHIPSVDFWINPDCMRLDEYPLQVIFSGIGHGQSRSIRRSFRHFYTLQIERAERIRRLPRDIAGYTFVLTQMRDALVFLIKAATDASANMMLMPFHLMQRELFVTTDAQKLLDDIDSGLANLKESLEKAMHGRAAHQLPHLQLTAEQTPAQITAGVNALQPYTPTGAISFGTTPEIHHLPAIPTPSPFPAGVFHNWGDMAAARGVWLTPYGICFGSQLISSTKGAVTIAKGACLASCAPNVSALNRGKWCVAPTTCMGPASHDRQDGTTDDDYTSNTVPANEDRSQWTIVVPPNAACLDANGKVLEAPSPPWQGDKSPHGSPWPWPHRPTQALSNGDGSSSRDGGRGGRGRGTDGKGKGGKGKGKGKGGKGSKGGKDMAGQKRTNFEWQSTEGPKATAAGIHHLCSPLSYHAKPRAHIHAPAPLTFVRPTNMHTYERHTRPLKMHSVSQCGSKGSTRRSISGLQLPYRKTQASRLRK